MDCEIFANKPSFKAKITSHHKSNSPPVQAWAAAGFPPDKLVVVPQQRDADPEFSTVDFPNPEEGATALDLAFQTAEAAAATYILANDPDADRLGVAQRRGDGTWKILSGNEIGGLLGWWLLECHKQNGDRSSAANRLIGEVVQSRRRPLLGPSPD